MSPDAGLSSASPPVGSGLVLQFRFSGSANIIETRRLTSSGVTKHVIGRGIHFEQPPEITQSRVLSRKHATLTLNPSGTSATLVDHRSSHGTKVMRGLQKFLLSDACTSIHVKPGDVIKLGKELKKDGQTHKPLYCYVDTNAARPSTTTASKSSSTPEDCQLPSGHKGSSITPPVEPTTISAIPAVPALSVLPSIRPAVADAVNRSTNHIKLTEAEQLPDAIEISDDDDDDREEEDDRDEVQVTSYKASGQFNQDCTPPASQRATGLGSISDGDVDAGEGLRMAADGDNTSSEALGEPETAQEQVSTPSTQEDSLEVGLHDDDEAIAAWTKEQREVLTELADLEEEQHVHERQSQSPVVVSETAGDEHGLGDAETHGDEAASVTHPELADETEETMRSADVEFLCTDDECAVPPTTAAAGDNGDAEGKAEADAAPVASGSTDSDDPWPSESAALETTVEQVVAEVTAPEAIDQGHEEVSSEVTVVEGTSSNDADDSKASMYAPFALGQGAIDENYTSVSRGQKRGAEEELGTAGTESNQVADTAPVAARVVSSRSKRQRTQDIAMGVFVGAVSTFATLVVMGGAQGE